MLFSVPCCRSCWEGEPCGEREYDVRGVNIAGFFASELTFTKLLEAHTYASDMCIMIFPVIKRVHPWKDTLVSIPDEQRIPGAIM